MINSQVASTSQNLNTIAQPNLIQDNGTGKKPKRPRHRNRKKNNPIQNAEASMSNSTLSLCSNKSNRSRRSSESSSVNNMTMRQKRDFRRSQRIPFDLYHSVNNLSLNSNYSNEDNDDNNDMGGIASVDLSISRVKRPLGRIYRKKLKRRVRIKLDSYRNATTGRVLIFETQAYRDWAAQNPLKSISKKPSIDDQPPTEINKSKNNKNVELNKSLTNNQSEKTKTPKESKRKRNKKENKKEQQQQNQKKQQNESHEKLPFPDYLSLDQIENGLKTGELIKGIIRINPKNFKEAYVGNEDIAKADYIITSVLDRNRALEGDEVILRHKKSTNKELEHNYKCVEVVYLLKKIHSRIAIGFLQPIKKNKDYAELCPRDKRIPKIRIPKICWPNGFQEHPEKYSNILLQAKLIEWNNTAYSEGVITDILGHVGDLKIESVAILKEFCLDPTPYTGDVSSIISKSSKILDSDLLSREDLRKECIFTIDPATARDLDDAVSCKLLENGNYEIGVHISDASYYLQDGTYLDEFVRKKATTIYMVEQAYHMLPIELCLLCSLLPGQDKLTFSVFWEFTPDGEIINERISRSVINSCTQLSYEHAQMIIDSTTDKINQFNDNDLPPIFNNFTSDDLVKSINILHKLSIILRNKRIQNGALRIDQPKLSFAMDPITGEPLNYWIYENKPAHRLIEEFMLLANITVAKAIYKAYPDIAFLRMHEPPKHIMLDQLQKSLESIGIHIDITSSGGIYSSLLKYTGDDVLAQSRMVVLNHLFTKPMIRAKYFCSGAIEDDDFSHYALSIPIYTHFTSPIRRYADIMVHRLLAASLRYQDRPNWTPEEVAEIAANCNRQKYNAKKAGEASSELYLAHYIEKHQPFVQKAVVVDVKERTCDIIILSTGTVVRLYSNNFGNDVTWKAESISTDSTNNDRKLWRILVFFPEAKKRPANTLILELFTVITVALQRKPKTNKLEAKLLRTK